MKIIITESQEIMLQILRRTRDDLVWIREIVDEGTDLYYPCQFKTEDEYLEVVSTTSAETYLLNFFNDWQDKLFAPLCLYIKNIIKKKMGKDVKEYYRYTIEDECV
jgi:hypothetical protein